MRNLLAGILALVLFIVLFVTVLHGGDDEQRCLPGSSDAASESGLVPEGAYALPEKQGMEHITSGWRTADRPTHRGVDIAQGAGTPIYAFADGVVSKAGAAGGFGQWVVIDHQIDGKLYSTVYGHMFPDSIRVKAGQEVKAGYHIADEGYNGEVFPPGPGGSHVHFEVWDGGRDAGQDIDPVPWLEKAVEPGSGDSSSESKSDTSDEQETSRPSNSSPGGEMPDTDVLLAKEHLQIDTIRVARAVAQRFPQIQTIGGWRPYDPYPDHPSGRAADIMIPNWDTAEGKQLGDDILAYLWGNRDYFQVEYFIWRQTYIPAQGESNVMEDRGSSTANHYDHIHVTTVGHGFPQPGQKYGPAPEGGSAVPGDPSGTLGDGCDPIVGVDAGLDAGEIPAEFVKWIELAGGLCEEISAPLVAGLIYQESQFSTTAVSSAGATGPAQFMPGTWASSGAKVDETGQVVGPPGSGSPNDIADAVMAAGRYLCGSAKQVKQWKAEGKVSGDDTELILATYNAGGGNVLTYGGVPPFAETQQYVKVIPEHAEKFAKK
ncbi:MULTISPECIES: peptidoglycan DD-metalloendopeptidase family protein [Corynebacterium]|uniref:peptidoglycan DD-metalloendopeptidase family protein n=1 Tax=Corynebacterium TaxID=1716 RepID=UPI00124F1C05|nr:MULTISPECIES: peptidoglycan DD-metalloendopeptidase family protein [Corynebacterium]